MSRDLNEVSSWGKGIPRAKQSLCKGPGAGLCQVEQLGGLCGWTEGREGDKGKAWRGRDRSCRTL